MEPVISVSKNIPDFATKLKKVEISKLPISDYCKRYLQHLLAHSNYYLSIYTHVLDNLLQHTDKSIEHISLLDYGAGNGLLGIYAKYCGFNKVYICDMNSDFVDASKLLAAELNIFIDDFIAGDINTFQAAIDGHRIDAVLGTDVIEHIYNLDIFFATIRNINPEMFTVFTTASNPDNFIKAKHLKKIQLKDEYKGSDPNDFILAGAEMHEPFIVIRKKIIQENFPQLSAQHLKELSQATRGLNRADIIISTQQFIETGQMPKPDANSANTCDPITGSWTERILSIREYESIYAKHGYSLILKNGFYNDSNPGIKKIVNIGLNILTKFTGRITAPFITLIGYKPV